MQQIWPRPAFIANTFPCTLVGIVPIRPEDLGILDIPAIRETTPLFQDVAPRNLGALVAWLQTKDINN